MSYAIVCIVCRGLYYLKKLSILKSNKNIKYGLYDLIVGVYFDPLSIFKDSYNEKCIIKVIEYEIMNLLTCQNLLLLIT